MNPYTVGIHTYGKPKVISYAQGKGCKIGSYCSIADGVTILTGGEHDTRTVSTYPFNELLHVGNKIGLSKGDVIIGNDVWIGHNVLILSGVTIGSGAVVGAGSVVASDVGDYAIVAGNPAQLIRYRFNASQINELLRIRWWDWPEEKVLAAADALTGEDINGFIERYG